MNGTMDFAAAAVQSLGALLLVLMIMGAGLFWLRRRLGPSATGLAGGSIKVVASACLGLRKTICVVDVMGTLLVVAISRDDIRLLDRLDPATLPPAPASAPAAKGFAAQLKQMLGAGEGRCDD